jgi:hypothetical protein
MQALVGHLEIIKKEVGRAATISYVDSWPKRNAKKKEIKIVVGDYVMLYQPVHVPGAATKLTTSWNGPRKVVGRRSKEFDLVHIESGKCASQHVTNLTSAPDPAHAEDSNDQYAAAVQKVDLVGRIPTEHHLVDAEMLVVNVKSGESGVPTRNAVAQVMETYQDGSAMVRWWNFKKLDGSAGAAFYPVWYTPEAKLGETASVVGEMSLWEMVPRGDMVAVLCLIVSAFLRRKGVFHCRRQSGNT